MVVRRRMAWAVALAAAACWTGVVRAAAPSWNAAPALAAAWTDDPEDDGQESPAERAEELYEEGTDALDEEEWDQALRAFDQVLRLGGARAEGARYWRAYALAKSGRKPEALAALAELRKQAPQGRWAKEGQALEIEIRQESGQRPAPESVADEELKLIALNALMSAEASRAIPMLERFLSSSVSRRLRDRALFVLAQSDAPEARAIVLDVARGRRNPDLQRAAIRHLGALGSAEGRRALGEIYASATDTSIKKAVLQAFMVSEDKASLLAAARGEASPELRRAAIQQLGAMGAQPELWEMYRAESNVEVKKNILHAMFIGGGDERLIDLARTEPNPELRRAVVRNLGLMGSARTSDALVALYRGDADPAIRKEAVQGLFVSGNAAALVRLAREEKDPKMRKELVSKLSLMEDKVAVDYMMELLK